MNLNQLKTLPFYIKLACILFSLLALGYIIIIGKEVISPIIFSCLFSILLLPLANFLEKKIKLPRSAASLLSVIIFLACIGTLMYIIGTQIAKLSSDWPQFEQQLNKSVELIKSWVSEKLHINANKQLSYVHDATNKIIASGTTVLSATLISISSVLLFFAFIFIYTFFFLLYRKLIKNFLEAVFLEENKKTVHDIIEQVQFIIRKYIIGLMLEMLIVAIIVCTAFVLFGIKYAILLGLITALFNLIPYIGIFTALVISCIITFATAAVASKVLVVIAILIGTHAIDSNLLLPLIVGSKVRINALITVLGVILGEMIWGISGMFLSIPVIAVMKIIFDRVDDLKPWGIILGDEENKQNKLAKSPKGMKIKKLQADK